MSARRRGIVLRVLIVRMPTTGCGGRAELLTGIDGVSSPVRRIVLGR